MVLACLTAVPGANAATTAPASKAQPTASLTPHYRGNAPYDARDAEDFAAQPTVNQASARAGLVASLGEQGVVDIDPLTGTPRVIARLDGFLTEPSIEAPAQIVTDYVRGHIDAFGLSALDLSSFHLVRDYVDIYGTHHLYWVQSFDGVPSFDHGLIASVTGDGRLINVLGSPMSGLFVHSTTPQLSANSAVTLARENSGAAVTTPAPLVSQSPGKTRTAEYANGDSASLVLFGDARGTQLAWLVDAQASSTEHDLSVVDATTGAVLWRTNLVQFADVTGHGLAWQFDDTSLLPPAVGRQQMRQFPVANSKRLFGNNAHVFADVNDDDHPKPGAFPSGDEIPASNKGTHTWAYHVNANTSTPARNCNAKFPCTWNSGVGHSWQTNLRQNATQVYFYLNNYHNHLLAPPIGFTEAAGNFQLVNKTGQGRANDPVLGQIDDGANTAGGFPDPNHQDNANMNTPRDGHSPTMQMYLFPANSLNNDNPDANGGDEADIVYHEYTHGLSNRLITDAQGIPSLNAFQSGAMGEAWSDWYAMDFLAKQGFQKDTSTPGDVRLGFYTGGGHTQPIRTEGMDCPPSQSKPLCHGAGNAGPGGYTLGDMGKIASNGFQTFPEVHADGEIWGQTLWQIRQRLIASLGASAGVARAENIVTRAMELSPPSPSMLDERNAILQADQVVAGGHDRNLLWSVFASRGMGFFAHVDSANDISPVQNFTTPPSCSNPTHCGTIQGTVRDADTNVPVAGATVAIVDHSTQGQPQSPDNLLDVTAADGTYSIPDVPRHNGYTLVVLKRGYEPSPVTVSVQSATVTRDRSIHFDWASRQAGANIISFTPPDYSAFGCGPQGANDLTEGSGWSSDAPGNGESGFTGPRQVTIRLPHAVDITSFALDPSPACSPPDRSATAVKFFKIETKTASGGFVTAVAKHQAGPLGQFTTVIPTAGKHNVLFVRFTMISNRGDHNFMDMTELTAHGTAS